MRRVRRAAALLGACACLVVAVVGCRPTRAFYEVPDPLPGTPGEVVRTLRVMWSRDDTYYGMALMYGSTTAAGEPAAVTGTVYVPTTPWTGPGSRPVIGVAPGTQGLGDRCAPSLAMPLGSYYEQGIVAGLLDAGWAVAVTDYEGMGTPGDPTYMVKDAEAHAVLDIVRAARSVPELRERGVTEASPVGLWGYSQGGQAVSAAAELAPAYAPDVPVAGVVAGGVPSDLAVMTEHLDGEGNQFFAFLAFAAVGLDSAYPELDLDSYLNDEGAALLDRARSGDGVCLSDGIPLVTGRHVAELTTSDPLATTAWSSRIAEQRLGTAPAVPPVFLYHGGVDQIVPPVLGRDLAAAWCAAGSDVVFTEYPVDHLGGIAVATTDGVAYLTARFAGEAAPTTCP